MVLSAPARAGTAVSDILAAVFQEMQKDLKIGLLVGLVIVSVAGLWLATRPSLTPQARLLDQNNVWPGSGSFEPPVGGERAEVAGSVRGRDNRDATTASQPTPRTPARSGAEDISLATPAAHAQPETIRPQRFHIVRQGETLSEISYEYYGSASKWRKIFEANRGTVKDANVVRAGTKLIIPN